MVFGSAAADEVDTGDAGDPEEADLEIVARLLPELDDAARAARQADAEDGEGRKGQAEDRGFDRRGQRRPGLREAAEDVELRLDHIDGPIEEHADLGGTAPGRRADLGDATDVLHRLFDRARDGGHHLVGRHDPIIDEDDDAREIRLREDRRRERQSGIGPGQAKREADEDDGDGVARREGTDGGIFAHGT